MTNDQIPMTNEEDNDQFTNNELTKGKGRRDCLYHSGYWLFFFQNHVLMNLKR